MSLLLNNFLHFVSAKLVSCVYFTVFSDLVNCFLAVKDKKPRSFCCFEDWSVEDGSGDWKFCVGVSPILNYFEYFNAFASSVVF